MLDYFCRKIFSNDVEFYSCLELNISSCPYTEENDSFTVTLYNPLSRYVSPYIRLPVRQGFYEVKDIDGKDSVLLMVSRITLEKKIAGNELITQMIPIPQEVFNIPGRISGKGTHELIFQAVDIPPLGRQAYHVQRSDSEDNESLESDSTFISNDVS